MTAADFCAFYQAVHGYPPFPWQQRLLNKVVESGWPSTIALPTSSGKTSVVDVAVYHLALEAGKGALERTAPLRVFFVIDRRVVVDEAAEHAMVLARALIQKDEGVVREVAGALKSFGAAYPLDVAVLRGGMPRDNSWADEPNQPLICVSTVDQVGSRLLFRGYQVSDEARSVHAALVGNDSLLVVDEAHLSGPFLDTVAAVKMRAPGHPRISQGITLVRMSATPGDASDVFELQEDDYATPELSGRLNASKPTEIRTAPRNLEDDLARSAKELSALPEVSVVGVVVNTVAVARAVFEELRKVKNAEAVLLTGRNRQFNTQKLWKRYRDRIAAKKNRVSEGNLFVVATQTVEVGANIDFDALVSESAPLDALRQRFGRLNRLGKPGEAPAIIVRRPKEDPVYGFVTDRTWDFLVALPKVDFGVLAMNSALRGQDVSVLAPERKVGPLVFGKHLELFAQTNPSPDPDPDVAPFLHGKDALDDADIQVVWREDVLEGETDKWQAAVEVAPPVASESLALPLGTLRRWLRGESKDIVSDLEGVPGGEEDIRKTAKKILVWRGRSVEKPLTDIRQIRPGDVVVVPSSYGGCDEFGWNPSSRELVEDLGDAANNQMAALGLRRFRVRLDLYAKHLQGDDQVAFAALLKQARSQSEEGLDAIARDKIVRLLEERFELPPGTLRIDLPGLLAVAKTMRPRPSREIPDLLKSEGEGDISVGLQKRIFLRDHVAGVVEHTRLYANKCGIHADLASDLVKAAELHDLGKWDERFQAMLCGKRLADIDQLDDPLAKSDGGRTALERRQSLEIAGYPKGARHELASVLLACASGALANANDQELVLHLIGTHHGYGRPLPPVWNEEASQTVFARFEGRNLETATGHELGRFDSGWIERFQRLNQRYGYWGLAYLEAILRRADCVQSRKEQES